MLKEKYIKFIYDLCTISWLFFFLLFSQQSISLIGSRFASSDSQYKAYLLKSEEDADVSVEFGPKNGDKNVFNTLKQGFFEEFPFNVSKTKMGFILDTLKFFIMDWSIFDSNSDKLILYIF